MPVCTIVATVPVSTAAVENADPWTGGAYDDDRAVGSADTRGSSMEACATSLPGFGWDDCQRACRGNRRNGQYKNLLMITSQSERSRRIERALHARPRAFRRNDLNFFWRRRVKRQFSVYELGVSRLLFRFATVG